MLTDVAARKAKPAEKPYKLADAGGLFLFITPAGGKLWRLKYRYPDHKGALREKLLSIGPYPDIGLAEAREARDAAKRLLRDGRDPGVAKRLRVAENVASAADTFEVTAREWHALKAPQWEAVHAADVLTSLERDVFPVIGRDPVRGIEAPAVLDLLRGIEKRGSVETAHRVRQRISAVFVYAIAKGVAKDDPAAIVKGALKPVVRGKQPAITDLDEAREMLRRAEGMPAHPVTKVALRFLALTVVRPGTLVDTPWEELADLDPAAPVWRIPPGRMKMRLHHKADATREHWVPLVPQAMDCLAVLRKLSGRGLLVFPNARHPHRPMSENAIGYLLNRAGYHQRHVPHGWRATFSTILNERFKADRQVIDLMLAHVPKDKVEAAYNRAAHLERRRELAQTWADLLLDGFPPAASLIEGRRRS